MDVHAATRDVYVDPSRARPGQAPLRIRRPPWPRPGFRLARLLRPPIRCMPRLEGQASTHHSPSRSIAPAAARRPLLFPHTHDASTHGARGSVATATARSRSANNNLACCYYLSRLVRTSRPSISLGKYVASIGLAVQSVSSCDISILLINLNLKVRSIHASLIGLALPAACSSGFFLFLIAVQLIIYIARVLARERALDRGASSGSSSSSGDRWMDLPAHWDVTTKKSW